jgi:hypothetical protein
MLSFRRAQRRSSAPLHVPLPRTRGDGAARAQAGGMALLANVSTMRRTISLPSISGHLAQSRSNTPSPLTNPPAVVQACMPAVTRQTEAEKAAREAEELAEDKRAVRTEFDRYLGDGLVGTGSPLNLVGYWDVSSREYAVNEN